MRFPLFLSSFCLSALVLSPSLSLSAESRAGYITDIHAPDQITLDMRPVRITPKTRIRIFFPDIDGELESSVNGMLPGMKATVEGKEIPQATISSRRR